MKNLLFIIDAYDGQLNDPYGDGTGTDRRPPHGADYNELSQLIRKELAKPFKVYLLTAEHFSQPGFINKPFASIEGATAEAVELVNIMLKDHADDGDMIQWATVDTWESRIAWLQDYHGAAHCFVEITETELKA